MAKNGSKKWPLLEEKERNSSGQFTKSFSPFCRKCIICGNKFWIKNNRDILRRKYCSLTCYHKTPVWNKNKKGVQKAWNKTDLYKICVICGKRYKVTPSRFEISKCCSRKCLGKYANQQIEDDVRDQMTRSHIKFPAVFVIEQLRSLERKLGRSPVCQDDSQLANAAIKRFGSWRKALEIAGIPIKAYKSIEDIWLDSSHEYEIDRQLHSKQIKHEHYVVFRDSFNKRYIADFVILPNLIIEYFGFNPDIHKYERRVREKIAFYESLDDWEFLTLFLKDKNNAIEIIERKITTIGSREAIHI